MIHGLTYTGALIGCMIAVPLVYFALRKPS
jgi:hypothetical protein